MGASITVAAKMHMHIHMMSDLNGTSLASLGSLKCLQGLFQCIGVSDERLNIHTARGYHLQGSWVAEHSTKRSIDQFHVTMYVLRYLPVSISEDTTDVNLSH